jgi:hypothetical protein
VSAENKRQNGRVWNLMDQDATSIESRKYSVPPRDIIPSHSAKNSKNATSNKKNKKKIK